MDLFIKVIFSGKCTKFDVINSRFKFNPPPRTAVPSDRLTSITSPQPLNFNIPIIPNFYDLSLKTHGDSESTIIG